MAGSTARRNTAITAAVLYFISIPFLIICCIANIPGIPSIYLLKLDVSHIIPISSGNSRLLNSVARSLGLHDFYQVGIWNFCEGYLDEYVCPLSLSSLLTLNRGVTFCSEPKQFYWFNPVEILVGELLAGAQIALPSQVVTILDLLKIGSMVMYGFFMAGLIFNFFLLFLTPLVIRTRWYSLLVTLIGTIATILVVVASIIATVIMVAAKVALTAQDELNIRADIGVKFFAFMWVAAGCTLLAWCLHAGMGCCCKPERRDPQNSGASQDEKRPTIQLPSFVRRRRGAASTE